MRQPSRPWTDADLGQLQKLARTGINTDAIAQAMGRHRQNVRDRAARHGIAIRKRTRYVWTVAERKHVRQHYANTETKLLAKQMGRSLTSVYQCAIKLGIHKSANYLASPAACRLRRGDEVGKAFRYPKGNVPANKGTRRPGFAPGRMAETMFKPGSRPHTWKPVGSTRINADGYLDRKISDTGYPPRDWKGEHILLWEEHLGPVPPKHCICFKNNDKSDVRIDNLACISRAERMRRNTIHRYPVEVKQTIRAIGKLRRTIEDAHEKQNPGSTRPPVRHHRRASRSGASTAHRQSTGDR